MPVRVQEFHMERADFHDDLGTILDVVGVHLRPTEIADLDHAARTRSALAFGMDQVGDVKCPIVACDISAYSVTYPFINEYDAFFQRKFKADRGVINLIDSVPVTDDGGGSGN